MNIIIILIPFFLIGTIPFGVLIAKAKGVDLTVTGSGNIGATNVARSVGKKEGIITLVLDLLKGTVSVLIAALISNDPWLPGLAGVAAVTGHCISIPGFRKGGKGAATTLGVALSLSPLSALFGVLAFVATFYFTKIVSVSTISAMIAAPLFAFLSSLPDEISIPLSFIAIIVTLRHYENLNRLIHGKEPKFSVAK